jgi:hypothetical protein
VNDASVPDSGQYLRWKFTVTWVQPSFCATGKHRVPQERLKTAFRSSRPGGPNTIFCNPVARILKETVNDSSSPWGEGRVEGGR